MPSSVMLIALRGRPLTEELRAVPDVLKPGSDVSESSALRLVSGRLVICCAGQVGRDRRRLRLHDERAVADDGDVLFERADRSVTFTLAGTAAFSVTEFSTAVLKPISDTVTE